MSEMVTVIIPAYNAEKTLADAVHSAAAQELSETGAGAMSIIIIDDASTDGTTQVIDELKAKYPGLIIGLHNSKNMGQASCRNLGIEQATGEYIAFLDADDVWREGKLKAQLRVMDRTGAVMCATARELYDADMNSMGRTIPIAKKVSYRDLLTDNSIACSSVLIKSDIVKRFRMMDGDIHEDYILWLQILREYGWGAGINKPYLKSRLSDSGKSRAKLHAAVMRFRSYRAAGIAAIPAALYFCVYAVKGILKYRGVRIKL